MLRHGGKYKGRRLAVVRETFCGTESNKMTAVRELSLVLGLMAIVYKPSEIGKMTFVGATCRRHAQLLLANCCL